MKRKGEREREREGSKERQLRKWRDNEENHKRRVRTECDNMMKRRAGIDLGCLTWCQDSELG